MVVANEQKFGIQVNIQLPNFNFVAKNERRQINNHILKICKK